MEKNDDEQIEQIRNQAAQEVKTVLDKLENDYLGITEGMATAFGASVGAAGSLAALSSLGYAGLSAPGITSGLAAAGSVFGGGMVAGIGALALPIAILGVTGYALAKRHKNAKLSLALGLAIKKLCETQERLLLNAEYFKQEIAGIKAAIDLLTRKKPA